MHAQVISVQKNLDSNEEIPNHLLSDLSYSLDLGDSIPNLFESSNKEPEFPILTSESDSSISDFTEVAKILSNKNNEIKLAIRHHFTNLKIASEQILQVSNLNSFNKIIEDIKDIKSPTVKLFEKSEIKTLETEENYGIMQEMVMNVKILNKNLQLAKENLIADKQNLNELEAEHKNLTTKLGNITENISESLKQKESRKALDIICKCLMF